MGRAVLCAWVQYDGTGRCGWQPQHKPERHTLAELKRLFVEPLTPSARVGGGTSIQHGERDFSILPFARALSLHQCPCALPDLRNGATEFDEAVRPALAGLAPGLRAPPSFGVAVSRTDADVSARRNLIHWNVQLRLPQGGTHELGTLHEIVILHCFRACDSPFRDIL